MNEFPNYCIIWHKDIGNDEDFEKIYLKLFLQIHNCLPFKTIDQNSTYGEEDIKLLEDVLEKKMLDDIINNDEDGVYFMCVIDNNENEIFTELL